MLARTLRGPVYRFTLLSILILSLAGSASVGASSSSQSSKFADPAFERVWQRTDLPVSRGDVSRTWYWGPQPGKSLQEGYQTSSGALAQHFVQYFDKARMEINDRSVDPNSPWYVTNGLLTVELIAGEPATGGPFAHAPRPAADIPLASDLSDTNAPTYKSFRAVADVPGNEGHQANPDPANHRQPATAIINRNGQVGSDPSKASLGEAVEYAYYESETHHNIVAAFWYFLRSTDLVYENGQTKSRLLSDPWFYATGYPISEAYWAKAIIAGKPHDVLIQAFQRRVLTYVPDNPAGWRVQMGNIGQHYYQWRYGGQPAPASTPASTATAAPVGKLAGRIAFVSNRSGSSETIFTMAPDGSDLRQVATTPGNNSSPRYAPNSRSIAYVNLPSGVSSGGSGGPAAQPDSVIMFTTDTPGSVGAPMGATTVPKWDSQSDPAYSPDGIFLVFRGLPSGDKPGLFIANLASEAPVIPVRRLTTGDWDRQPVWSPDGKQIAYTSSDSADNGQVWVINSDGSGKRRLTDVVAKQLDQDPAWSPDGKKLLYATNKGTGKFNIMSVSPDGTPGPAITGANNASQRYPCYSPDGKLITFSNDIEGNWDIDIIDADGSHWINITNSPSTDIQPRWGK